MYNGYHSSGNSDGQFTQTPSHIGDTDPVASMYNSIMATIPVGCGDSEGQSTLIIYHTVDMDTATAMYSGDHFSVLTQRPFHT